MNSSNAIYNLRSGGSAHGDVFTRHEVVVRMLDMVGYTSDRNLQKVRIVEPSCGNGEFLLEMLSRLRASSRRYGFDFDAACRKCILACDIDSQKISDCIRRMSQRFPELSDFGDFIVCEDFLLADHAPVDMVVGNPPYIRYEEIPEEKRNLYKSLFSTFHYRTDIYVLFFEKSLRLLNPGGRHCFICANRWMKNQYGRKLRRMIASGFRIDRIIDMEQTDAFHEEVLAYPAITMIENRPPSAKFALASVKSISGMEKPDFVMLNSPSGEDWSEVFFPYGNLDRLTTIERQGLKIGIGIATGADSIFVSPSLRGTVEDELLLPALSARNLSGDRFGWDGRYLLNPYSEDGTLICLDDYPMAKAYLESHYDRLTKRHKASKNLSRWYATIDNIHLPLLHEPKILLPDISANRYLFVDNGEYYPQHNLYYITGMDGRMLRLLAALLMSDVIRSQLDSLSNHMNGGYVRWQSQYLRKLRVPQLSSIPADVADELLMAYDKRDYHAIDRISENIVQETYHVCRFAAVI